MEDHKSTGDEETTSRKRPRTALDNGEEEEEIKTLSLDVLPVSEWSPFVVGEMERGLVMEFPSLEQFDSPDDNSFMFWGLVWLEGVSLDVISKVASATGGQIVDNIHATTYCIKLTQLQMPTHCMKQTKLQMPMIINKGPRPCVASAAEITNATWFHFWHRVECMQVYEAVDGLFKLLPQGVRVYLVAGLQPLKLLHIMSRADAERQGLYSNKVEAVQALQQVPSLSKNSKHGTGTAEEGQERVGNAHHAL